MTAKSVQNKRVGSSSLAKTLTFTAVFAALCAVSTLVIAIPLPNGYFNTGDVFVLLSGWFLGPLWGSVAAGTGSALADVLSGYAIYAPATFAIKAVDAMLAYAVCALWKAIIKKERLDFLPRLFSALCGEIVMVLGYFLYESALYGFVGGAAALVGNVLQGACCLACAVALCSLLRPVKSVRNLFPHLK